MSKNKDDVTKASVDLLTEIVKTGGSLSADQMQRATDIITDAMKHGVTPSTLRRSVPAELPVAA